MGTCKTSRDAHALDDTIRDNPVIVVALRAHRSLTHSRTHAHPKFSCACGELILPAADGDDETMPMTPISHLRALEAVPDGLEACVERWSQGSRTRAASLIVSLCRKFDVSFEVATALVKGMSTPVDGHGHPGRRKQRKRGSPVDERTLSFADFAENYTSPDRPPPYVSPCRQYETQASYWMNEHETNQYIVDRINLTRAALSKPKKYTADSDAYRLVLNCLK